MGEELVDPTVIVRIASHPEPGETKPGSGNESDCRPAKLACKDENYADRDSGERPDRCRRIPDDPPSISLFSARRDMQSPNDEGPAEAGPSKVETVGIEPTSAGA
jgi:hypothetical protein